MNMTKKVILLVPTFNNANIWNEWSKYIYKLDPQPELIVFAENNSYDSTLNNIIKCKLPHELIRIWVRDDASTVTTPWTVIAHIRQLLLTRARQIDPDYAIFVDDDVFIHTVDMIDVLTGWQVDIVGGAYARIFPHGTFVASTWKDDEDFIWREKARQALDEPLMTSAGCMCLSRKVIQDRRLNFFPMHKVPKINGEDFVYCILARELGYDIYLDGLVRLSHVQQRIRRPWNERYFETYRFSQASPGAKKKKYKQRRKRRVGNKKII